MGRLSNAVAGVLVAGVVVAAVVVVVVGVVVATAVVVVKLNNINSKQTFSMLLRLFMFTFATILATTTRGSKNAPSNHRQHERIGLGKYFRISI